MNNNTCLKVLHKGYCIACNYWFPCVPGFSTTIPKGSFLLGTHKITGIKPVYYSIIRSISKKIAGIANPKLLSLIFTVRTYPPLQ